MKTFTKALATALVIAAGSVMSAQAATLNFLAEGNASERGEASGYVLNNANTGGLNVKLTSNYNPYFDGGNAGLGVCKTLNSGKQCAPSSDDNVTTGEQVTLMFDFAMNLSNFVFRNAGHGILNNDRSFLLGLNGGPLVERTFEDIAASVLNGITSITFAYNDGGNNPNQFYISSIEAERGAGGQIPLPAGLPLLLAGLGVLGVAKRLKKA